MTDEATRVWPRVPQSIRNPTLKLVLYSSQLKTTWIVGGKHESIL